jgi:hypothetical protein
VLRAVAETRKLRLVILDACRDNPFADGAASSTWAGASAAGLAPVEIRGDILVAYAAKHGTVASDGSGENSPYAEALLRHLPTPGLDVRLMLGRVRDQVLGATAQQQEPFIYGTAGGGNIFLTVEALDEPAPRYSADRWVLTNGPYAEAPEAIAVDPNNPDVLYAGTRSGEVHRSLNTGWGWTLFGEPPTPRQKIYAVAAVPGSAYIVLAGTEGALLRRRSDVSAWEPVTYFEKLGRASARVITVDPRQPGLIYVGTGEHTSGVTAGAGSSGVASLSDREGAEIEIEWREGVTGGSVHRSLDGGRTWSTGGLPITNALAIAPGDPRVIAAATSDEGVFTTVDGGINWRRFKCLPSRYVAQAVAISSDRSRLFLVATDAGAFLLDLDAEKPCRPLVIAGAERFNGAAFTRESPARILLGSDTGLFQSTDGGATFAPFDDGILHKRVLGLMVTEQGTQLARVDVSGVMVRRSTDAAWQLAASRFSRGGVGAITFDPRAIYLLARSEACLQVTPAAAHFGCSAPAISTSSFPWLRSRRRRQRAVATLRYRGRRPRSS